MANRRALLVFVVCITSASAVGVDAAGDADWLPFYGSKTVVCGWHWTCGTPAATPGGIDLTFADGEVVRSAGRGSANGTCQSGVSYGNYVLIDHTDDHVTRYAHLSSWFIPSGGMPVCAGMPIGYAGTTGLGCAPGQWGAHLHFEAASGSPRFAPIRGSTTATYSESFFDTSSQSVSRATPVFSTKGYGASDNTHATPIFGSGSYTLQGWTVATGGYSIDGQGSATYLWAPAYVGPSSPQVYAYWSPHVPDNKTWEVYVFIPEAHATSKALYTILWRNPSTDLIEEFDVFLQQSNQGGWVKLAHPDKSQFLVDDGDPTGDWDFAVSFANFNSTDYCANSCMNPIANNCSNCQDGLEIAADAVLLVEVGCSP